MDTPRYRTTPVPHEGYPPGIPFIVGNEAAERFSYYGMKVLLTKYFLEVLNYTEVSATRAVHTFGVAVYLTPMLGSLIADRFWGKYRTIMVLSCVYCFGHLILALMDMKVFGDILQLTELQLKEYGLISGLALIALGAGGIKPCVSAHVGDQFAKGEEQKLQKIFGLFYFMINFGAGLSQILMPMVRKHWGQGWAFGIPGILMAVATLVFWLGRNRYVHVPPTGANPNSFWRVVFHALRNQSKRPPGGQWLDAARDRFDEHVIAGVRAVIGVIGLFTFISVFWMLQGQMSTTWTIQARSMDLQITAPTASGPGFSVEADQVQSLNAFLVLILIPFNTYVAYPLLGRMGFEMTALRRITSGMLLIFISFIMAGLIQVLIEREQAPSVLWQVPGYIVITLAEVLVSVTGLEFAYTQAPKSMKSTVMGFWLLSIALGEFLIAPFIELSNWLASHLEKLGLHGLAVVTENGEMTKVTAANFFMFAGAMFVAGIGFLIIARRYKPVNFMESAEGTTPAH